MTFRLHPLALATFAAGVLSACGGSDDASVNALPTGVSNLRTATYDGSSDDLLTAGLGQTGLQSASAPTYADPLNPTAAELRRAAIYTSYRALVDMTSNGGYGSLYGPMVGATGTAAASDGKVAGTEYVAFYNLSDSQQNVTVMAQVPATFDPANPCIVTATSSGSRGVYGAISTGEWGLKHGCAAAYTDKGTGAAPHDLQNDTVALMDGTRTSATAAGASAAFNAGLSTSELAAFNTATPNRFAFKHAHSGDNPEKDWGRFTLAAVRLAFYAINDRFGELNSKGEREVTFKPDNTLVIASSVSNGGGAAIAAAELDAEGLIDGVAVGEPAIEIPSGAGVTVQRGSTVVATSGKNLIDFTTQANLYQACASLAPSLTGAPYFASYGALFNSSALPLAANRCASLQQQGLLSAGATTTALQAEEALQRLRDYGWEAESAVLQPSLTAFEVSPAVATTFANALAGSKVNDHLCGFSYAAATSAGAVTTLAPAALASMFATGNGVPPSAGVQLINNNSLLGPVRDFVSVSAAGALDWNLTGALCLRNLLTGTDTASQRLQAGMAATQRNGNLRGKPAIIVHGRDDALLPVNHTSRPYVALNKKAEGSASQLRYIEVTNAQHFDGFIGLPAVLPGYDSRYVPLHVYLNRALDAVYAHLKSSTALPASQVVRTVPRGGTPGQAPAITTANVPAWASVPASADAITVTGSTVVIPD
jgi:hydroxybutyrate-dimer hydrolase